MTFRTEDGSAKAGQRYAETRATVEFGPGEALKSVEVSVTQDS